MSGGRVVGDGEQSVERKYNERHRRLRPLRLHLEDLQRIEELLRHPALPEEDKWSRVKFETSTHRAATVDALVDAEPDTHLRVFRASRAFNPHLWVDVTERAAHVHLDDDRPEFRGVYEELVELLIARQRRLAPIALEAWPVALAVLLSGVLTARGMLQGLTDASAVMVASFAGLTVGIAGAMVSRWHRTRIGGSSIIYLTPRSATETFWSRHGEHLAFEVAKAVIWAVVGALIAVVAGRMVSGSSGTDEAGVRLVEVVAHSGERSLEVLNEGHVVTVGSRWVQQSSGVGLAGSVSDVSTSTM